jgi:NAD(P) transhydrogenase
VADFDLIVIGSGPGGQKAAIAAAKLGKRVAIVERWDQVGGVCVNTGTLPSKTLREAVVYLTGLSLREIYGQSYRVKDDITMGDLQARTTHVIRRETEVIRDQLSRNRVTLLAGTARFADPHTLIVDRPGQPEELFRADRIVIAVGTRPARPASVAFDDRRVIDTDQLLEMDHVPASLVVVGAGVIGIEYASVFAALGTKVTVVEKRDRMLDHCDAEIVESLQYHLRDLDVVLRFNESVASVVTHPEGTLTTLESGKRIPADTVIYAAGRQGATDTLDLERAGLEADRRGRLAVDDHYRTAVPHIFAVGDVIGFPALAATSAEQGRLTAHFAFDEPAHSMPELLPIGIYTIPEISYVGRTEEELTAAAVDYEVGIARYRELARGAIIADSHGLLKLLVSPADRTLIGVHTVGTGATEMIHIGQTVMALGGTIDYLIDAVFNHPTLSEAYKVAALDASNKLRSLARIQGAVSA